MDDIPRATPLDGGRESSESCCSLAILAGGRSRRMGRDKPFVEFAGTTLVEWLLERVGGAFSHTFVVSKDVRPYLRLAVPAVADAAASFSPAVGVYTAVLASPTPYTLCLGCDIPFVTTRLLRLLADLAIGHEALVSRDGKWLQPLCAVYSKSTLGPLQEMIDKDERRIDLIFDRVRTRYVEEDSLGMEGVEESFLNVNTLEELGAARALLRTQSSPLCDAAVPASVSEAHAVGPRHAASLALRVEEFMAGAAVPTISFVGKKKSGKTTALEGVIRQLVARGRRVAAVKHDAHGFVIDAPGTDSARLR